MWVSVGVYVGCLDEEVDRARERGEGGSLVTQSGRVDKFFVDPL